MRSIVLHGVLLVSVLASSGCAADSAPPASGPTRTAAADPALRALMHDVAAGPQTCERLRGKMIGLPAEGQNLAPQQGGLAVIAGRWAIRDCDVRSDGRSILFHLGGLGWQWVDRQEKGFRISQYVYFAASVDLRGQLDVAYDPAARVASVWLTPDEVTAQVDALGNINVSPESLGAAVLGGLGSFVGLNPDRIARAKAGTEGAQQFRNRLRAGMSVTYDTNRQQLDMVLGALPNGIVPARPFSGPLPWAVNERVLLMPGGFQLVGPFESGPQPALLSARAEQGSGVAYRAICERDVWNALDASARGAQAMPLQGAGSVLPAGFGAEVSVQRPPCRWLLAISTPGPTPAVAALHMRTSGPSSTAGVGSAWVRVTLVGFKFNTTKPNGTPWDVGGGAPDPQFFVRSGANRSLFVPTRQDAFEGAPMVSSAPIEVTATTPLVIEVVDDDVAADDPMGFVTISLQQLSNGGTIRAPVMLGGIQVGVLSLAVEMRAGP